MDYITSHLDSFTKRIAEAINGRQINAEGSKPSKSKTIWDWEGTFTADRTIKVRKSPGLNGTVVESNSWLYSGNYVPFDQIIKKTVIGGLDLNMYKQDLVIKIFIVLSVKSLTSNKN